MGNFSRARQFHQPLMQSEHSLLNIIMLVAEKNSRLARISSPHRATEGCRFFDQEAWKPGRYMQ
jgi:hypothetical protein